MKHRNPGRSIAALLCASLTAVPARAADPPAVQPGQRVRIVAAAPGIFQGVATGTLLDAGPETLIVAQAEGGVLRLPRASVTRFEVSEGRRRHTRRGLLIGTAVGLALAPLMWSDEKMQCGTVDNPRLCTQGERKGIAVFMVGIFAGSGAFWGHRKHTDRWRDAPLDHLKVSVRPTRGGGRVALTLAF
jgi:hypothetical protein